MSTGSYHFFCWSQFKVISMGGILRTGNLSEISAMSDAGCIFANFRRLGIGLYNTVLLLVAFNQKVCCGWLSCNAILVTRRHARKGNPSCA